MDHFLRPVFSLFVICCVALNQGVAQDPSPVDKEALGKAAMLGCTANVQAFPFYRCRWRITNAEARSFEDAVAGKFVNAVSSDHRLIVDGEKDLYEGLTPPVPPDPKRAFPLPGKKGLSLIPAPICSNRYLSDGKREMNYVPQLEAANLWSNEKGILGIADTPLGAAYLGHRNRGMEKRAQMDIYEFFSDGLEEIGGKPFITVGFRNKQDRSVIRFSFDPSQGYLPVHTVHLFDGKPKVRNFITDVRECSKQRWFPERFVMVITPDKPGAPYSVREVKLLDLDADNRPDPKEFAVTLPAGTEVNDHFEVRKFFNLKQEEQIHVDDLPKLYKMLDQVQVNPLMDTAIVHSSPYAWVRWVGVAGGLGLAAGSLWLLWRRRGRAQAG